MIDEIVPSEALKFGPTEIHLIQAINMTVSLLTHPPQCIRGVILDYESLISIPSSDFGIVYLR